MADLTIFQLTQILPAAVDGAADLIPLWDNSVTETKKITVNDLKTVLGGLVNWTDNFSSATQATSQFAATNAAANVNAAITPKGTGALLVDMPDGTATGGNARGASAVDLQHSRLSATQVASGVASTIVGGVQNTNGSAYGVVGGIGNNAPNGNYATIFGYNNSLGNFLDAPTISGGRNHTVGVTYGVVGGGFSNTITAGQSSVIAGGASNTINSAATGLSFIGGGTLNSITSTNSVIGGGESNTIGGNYSIIGGGQSNSVGTALNAFIGGGFSNSVTNNYGVICGGYDNTQIGASGFVGGGESNNYASGSYGVLVGGQSNYLSANWGALVGGFQNQLNEQFTGVLGGRQANAFLYGMQAYSAGQFSALADAQAATIQMRAAITGTAITDLFLDGSSVRPILPATNTLWAVRVQLTAICTAVGNGTVVLGAAFAAERQCAIKRLNTTTALVGAVQTIGANLSDTSMSTAAVTITADDTNEALRVQFTPPSTAGTTSTFRVVATIQLTQVKY